MMSRQSCGSLPVHLMLDIGLHRTVNEHVDEHVEIC